MTDLLLMPTDVRDVAPWTDGDTPDRDIAPLDAICSRLDREARNLARQHIAHAERKISTVLQARRAMADLVAMSGCVPIFVKGRVRKATSSHLRSRVADEVVAEVSQRLYRLMTGDSFQPSRMLESSLAGYVSSVVKFETLNVLRKHSHRSGVTLALEESMMPEMDVEPVDRFLLAVTAQAVTWLHAHRRIDNRPYINAAAARLCFDIPRLDPVADPALRADIWQSVQEDRKYARRAAQDILHASDDAPLSPSPWYSLPRADVESLVEDHDEDMCALVLGEAVAPFPTIPAGKTSRIRRGLGLSQSPGHVNAVAEAVSAYAHGTPVAETISKMREAATATPWTPAQLMRRIHAQIVEHADADVKNARKTEFPS